MGYYFDFYVSTRFRRWVRRMRHKLADFIAYKEK